MTKVIGWLEEKASPTTGEIGYMGEIDVAYIKGRCAIVPAGQKRNERSPDYLVKIEVGGRFRDFGAVWMQSPEAGGDDFMSITIDHETMDKPVYCAAFPPSEDEDGGRWRMVWGRARRSRGAPAASEPLADQIPY